MEFQNEFSPDSALQQPAPKPKNKIKQKLAYLTALTLLFSYAEMILPRFLPFFRLGLSNAVILLSLEIEAGPFILLAFLKAIASSLMGGTLFSPFFLLSLVQSVLSALTMRLLYKTISRKFLGIYGISILGSVVSAAAQLLLASLYLGQGTLALFGPMILFNAVSGVLTGVLSELLKKELGGKLPEAQELSLETEDKTAKKTTDKSVFSKKYIFLGLLLLSSCIAVFFVKKLWILGGMFLASLILQRVLGRKIFWLPHISLWLFVFVTGLFTPAGKVLFQFWNLSVTEGALLLALKKALVLSTLSALSQCATRLPLGHGTILGMSLEYYRAMSDKFRSQKGNIVKRLIKCLV